MKVQVTLEYLTRLTTDLGFDASLLYHVHHPWTLIFGVIGSHAGNL